jgi:hypothetical protein
MRTSLPRDTFPLSYRRVVSPMLIFPGSGGYRCDPNPQKCCFPNPSSRGGSCLTRRTVRLERRTASRGRVCPWACVCMRKDFSERTSCALTLVPIPQHSMRRNGTAIDCGRMTSSRKRSNEEVKVPDTFLNPAAGLGGSGGFAFRRMVLRGHDGHSQTQAPKLSLRMIS